MIEGIIANIDPHTSGGSAEQNRMAAGLVAGSLEIPLRDDMTPADKREAAYLFCKEVKAMRNAIVKGAT